MTRRPASPDKISRRTFVQVASAMTAAATLGQTAQSGSVAAQAKTKLVVSSFYPLDTSSGWSELVQGFTSENPDIEIETQISPGEEYLQKLITQKASNTLPDVIAVEVTPFPSFVANDLLLNMSELLAQDTNFDANSFFPKLLDRYTVDGAIYGVPYDCQPVAGVFINKSHFTDTGLSLPSVDWTWDEFMNAASTLTQRDGDTTTRFGMVAGPWLNWVYAFGGRLVDDVKHPTQVIINTPEAIKGMQAYIDLIVKDKISPSDQYLEGGGLSAADLFATGLASMMHAGYWELVFDPSKYASLDLGFVKFPDGPGKGTAYTTGGTCYSVASSSKHPEEAYRFVKYFMGMPGWQAAFHGSKAGVIYPPAFIPAYESELFLKNPNPPIENMRINGDGAEFAVFGPFDPIWQEISTKYIDPDLDLLTSGEKTVEEVLNDWATKFTPMLTANQS